MNGSVKVALIVVSVLLVGGAITLLARASMGDAEYYVHVEDVVKNPKKYVGPCSTSPRAAAHRGSGQVEPDRYGRVEGSGIPANLVPISTLRNLHH